MAVEVLVTGGDTELGRAVAEGFRDAGHTITHSLVTTKIAMKPGPLHVCDGVDRPVVMIPVTGTDKTCVFVFDSESEAKRFRDARHLK